MLKRLRKDERGVAAMEFALIAPFMFLLYFGLAELTLGMMAGRRAGHAASVVGDLVTQTGSVNATEMTDIFSVGNAILKPFPTTPLKMRITSVKADTNGVPRVVWSRGQNLTALGAGAAISPFPANMLAVGDSVIMAEVQYTYDSPIHQVLPSSLAFSNKYYLKPRKSPEVLFTTG
jgi:Flp pilus assembly protein TadG